MPLDETENEIYLTVEQVAARYNTSTDSIYRWKREGNFPKAVYLSKGTTRWRRSDLVSYKTTLKVGFAACLAFPVCPFPEVVA